VAQGIRGPYSMHSGIQADGDEVWGPWGEYFGWDIGEVRSHLVPMQLPNGSDPAVTVYVHERAVPALQSVIDNLLREQAQGNVYQIDPRATSSFYPATIPPRRYLSFHAMGIAIDVNSLTNPYREDNVLVTDMPAWFVAAWTDAGWCWGGSWLDIKDPMHFSWKGPRFTPGSGAVAPMPVRTAAGDFSRSVSFDTALGAAGPTAILLAADLDRDGAPDVVEVAPLPGSGRLGVLAAEAIHRFDTCQALGPTPHAVPDGSTVVLADVDGDARPDLVVVGSDNGRASMVVYTHASGYTAHLPVIRTHIPWTSGAVALLDDLDLDGQADLWLIEPGDPGRLTVWAGPRFDEALTSTDLPGGSSGWRFAVGDRGGDGVPDFFALGPGGLVVLDGGSGFEEVERVATTPAAYQTGTLAAGDFDGDGRADLYVIGADGTATVYLGGDRSGVGDEALMSWFLMHDDQPWEYRQGCPFDPMQPR
jgi:hypothetical protein